MIEGENQNIDEMIDSIVDEELGITKAQQEASKERARQMMRGETGKQPEVSRTKSDEPGWSNINVKADPANIQSVETSTPQSAIKRGIQKGEDIMSGMPDAYRRDPNDR